MPEWSRCTPMAYRAEWFSCSSTRGFPPVDSARPVSTTRPSSISRRTAVEIVAPVSPVCLIKPPGSRRSLPHVSSHAAGLWLRRPPLLLPRARGTDRDTAHGIGRPRSRMKFVCRTNLGCMRSGAIGLVLARPTRLFGVEPFFMELIGGLEEAFSGLGLSILLQVVADQDEELETYRRWSASGVADAVIVFN